MRNRMKKLKCPKCGCTEIEVNKGYIYDEITIDGETVRVPIGEDYDVYCKNCGYPVGEDWKEFEEASEE